MANTCELLINVVRKNKPKDAERLEPKGTVVGTGALSSPVVDTQDHRRISRAFPITAQARNVKRQLEWLWPTFRATVSSGVPGTAFIVVAGWPTDGQAAVLHPPRLWSTA